MRTYWAIVARQAFEKAISAVGLSKEKIRQRGIIYTIAAAVAVAADSIQPLIDKGGWLLLLFVGVAAAFVAVFLYQMVAIPAAMWNEERAAERARDAAAKAAQMTREELDKLEALSKRGQTL